MDIAIHTLTSPLHDENSVEKATKEFLDGMNVDFILRGGDFSDYGSHSLDLIFVRTGGTEGLFKKLFPDLLAKSQRPFYILTSGKSNSLAASMEILSFLRQKGLAGEIIHGSNAYMTQRILLLAKVGEARRQLKGMRLGVVGKPSDWLISSTADYDVVRSRLGVDLVDVSIDELIETVKSQPVVQEKCPNIPKALQASWPGAISIYHGLKSLVEKHNLNGFTIRCFDLLSAVHNTGCLALARLNAEGVVAGCEGDVPAMLSMMLAKVLLGSSGFQANPSSIDVDNGEIVFAHCTIPLDMVEHFELDTHFESGIGIGVRGFVEEGPVTLFKVSGDLSRSFIAEGELLRCQANPSLCRTQLVVRLCDKNLTDYFLTNPIGNHHIILKGHHKALLQQIL